MDLIAPGHSESRRAMDTDSDVYEYRNNSLRPTDVGVLGQGETLFNLASMDSDEPSSGSGAGSQQSSFYGISGQQSSLTSSSSEGVGVSALILCQIQC